MRLDSDKHDIALLDNGVVAVEEGSPALPPPVAEPAAGGAGGDVGGRDCPGADEALGYSLCHRTSTHKPDLNIQAGHGKCLKQEENCCGPCVRRRVLGYSCWTIVPTTAAAAVWGN